MLLKMHERERSIRRQKYPGFFLITVSSVGSLTPLLSLVYTLLESLQRQLKYHRNAVSQHVSMFWYFNHRLSAC